MNLSYCVLLIVTFSETFLEAANKESNEINSREVKECGGEHWDDVTGEVVTTADVFGGHI